MAAEWYYQIMGTVVGPVTAEELRERAAKGQMEFNTLVRKGTNGNWVAAERIRGLFNGSDDAPKQVRPLPPPTIVFQAVDAAATGDTARLRSCPDCGQSVSKRADHCPKCGCPLDEVVPTNRATATLVETRLAVWSLRLLVIILMAGLFGINATVARGYPIFFPWVLCGIVFGYLGRIAGASKNAKTFGQYLGVVFGPLGVVVALMVDGRAKCSQCGGRVDGTPKLCPHCGSDFVSSREPLTMGESG